MLKTIWEHAQELIPGGSQLVSKRPNRYAPQLYPSHDIYCHGDKVVDAETNKEYTDMSLMGTGCCILGYGCPEVDSAAIQAIAQGSMGACNPIEELELAEVLLKLNPKMQKVRFARTGGEACMIAARIAKMANKGRGREPGDMYLQHGYSGWALGNPERSYSMQFNGMEVLDLLDNVMDEMSFIIMEPVRNFPDESVKLMKDVRKFATEYNIPLIIDEITAGFRCGLSGYHILKGVQPDIAVYGKALGNGYPISAVVGTDEIMASAEDTFLSSTMWSERIGYAAALATLDTMKKKKVPDYLMKTGKIVQDSWKDSADVLGLEVEVTGISPLAHFEFKEDNDKLMTFFTQEMLARGYLATDQWYASLGHSLEDIDTYLCNVNEVLTIISEGNVKLTGDVRDKGWRRQN